MTVAAAFEHIRLIRPRVLLHPLQRKGSIWFAASLSFGEKGFKRSFKIAYHSGSKQHDLFEGCVRFQSWRLQGFETILEHQLPGGAETLLTSHIVISLRIKDHWSLVFSQLQELCLVVTYENLHHSLDAGNKLFKEQKYPEAWKGAIQFFMKEYDKTHGDIKKG
ncbi:hypothetical protein Bca101_067455 [Brassica carinata]